jgi:hypothetical protein
LARVAFAELDKQSCGKSGSRCWLLAAAIGYWLLAIGFWLLALNSHARRIVDRERESAVPTAALPLNFFDPRKSVLSALSAIRFGFVVMKMSA